MSRSRLIAVIAVLASLPAAADTYGRQEHVRVQAELPVEVTARLDSGVERSELQAVNVKYFQRDGDTWVRFTVDNGSVLPGNHVTLERRVLKDVKIKQKGGGVEHRPLVEVELCLGDHSFKSLLSLTDRSSYTAPLLIGASELAQLGSVDAARQFTHEPSCKAAEAASSTESPDLPIRGTGTKSSKPSPTIVAYQCDGRTQCSQMHSCEEARFFINNCPNTAMDGDKDGVPCETQWCR